MRPLFVSSGFLPSSEQELIDAPDLSLLPPFLRVLLTTDGTVTKSLESYFWEQIDVQTRHQGMCVLHKPMPDINKNDGDEVWRREVVLVGHNSAKAYAYAKSYICLELLPQDMQLALKGGTIGIGGFLRQCNVETYRQIIAIGEEQSQDERGKNIWRTYRIVMNKQPLMTITESFPQWLYR